MILDTVHRSHVSPNQCRVWLIACIASALAMAMAISASANHGGDFQMDSWGTETWEPDGFGARFPSPAELHATHDSVRQPATDSDPFIAGGHAAHPSPIATRAPPDSDHEDASWRVGANLPEVPPYVEDFAVGLGSGLSFGGTDWINLHVTGYAANSVSRAYQNGRTAGQALLGGIAASTGARLLLPHTPYKLVSRLNWNGAFVPPRLSGSLAIVNKAAVSPRYRRLLALDPVLKLGSGGPLASRVPHFHLAGSTRHLPWQAPGAGFIAPALLGGSATRLADQPEPPDDGWSEHYSEEQRMCLLPTEN